MGSNTALHFLARGSVLFSRTTGDQSREMGANFTWVQQKTSKENY